MSRASELLDKISEAGLGLTGPLSAGRTIYHHSTGGARGQRRWADLTRQAGNTVTREFTPPAAGSGRLHGDLQVKSHPTEAAAHSHLTSRGFHPV